MRAWLLDDFNGTGSLRLGDYPDPLPRMGEAVLKVQYAGLNPADHYVALRQYPAKPPMPHILGRDGIGTVVAVGAGVSNITVGDRKIVLRGDVGVERPGTFADLVAVPVENLVDLPAGWSDTEAAGATLVYLTAYQALTMWGELGARAVVLVTGASGGVGVASIQLARAMGFEVVALSRSETKRARVVELGAKHCFDPTDPQSVLMTHMSAIVPAGNNATLTWPAMPGKSYQVQFTDSLINPNWVNFASGVAIVGNQGSVTVPATPATRFYRAVCEP